MHLNFGYVLIEICGLLLVATYFLLDWKMSVCRCHSTIKWVKTNEKLFFVIYTIYGRIVIHFYAQNEQLTVAEFRLVAFCLFCVHTVLIVLWENTRA